MLALLPYSLSRRACIFKDSILSLYVALHISPSFSRLPVPSLPSSRLSLCRLALGILCLARQMLGGRWDVNEAAFTYLAVLSWLVRNISCSGYFSTASLISCLSISVSQHFVCMYVCVCLCACACVRPCCSFLYKILTLFISMLQLKPSAYDWLSATPTKCPSNTEINWEANVFWKGVVLHTGVCVCECLCPYGLRFCNVFFWCICIQLSEQHARTHTKSKQSCNFNAPPNRLIQTTFCPW